MNNTHSVLTAKDNNNLRNTLLTKAQQLILDAAFSVESESKGKYATKAKLIESAEDMSTQEKLNALDRNYEQRNQESRQNAITFTVVSLGVFALIVGSSSAIKNVRKLMAA